METETLPVTVPFAASRTWFFTFGMGHTDEDGNSLGGCYVPIVVTGDEIVDDEGRAAACKKMYDARGDKYCTCYADAEEAGVEKWNYTERSLESVAFNKARIRSKRIAQIVAFERDRLEKELAAIGRIEQLIHRMPDSVLDQCRVYDTGLDVDNLNREQVKEVLATFKGGRWTKSINPASEDMIDYAIEIDGVRVRLWGAAPPDTCRIIEEPYEIPAAKAVRRRLICNEAPQ